MSARTDSVFAGIGDLHFPIDTARVRADGTLISLDSGDGLFAALFKSAINSELGDAWRLAIGGSHASFGSLPVADTLEAEPTAALMTQRKAAFPLLCVHREGEGTFDQLTLYDDRLTQMWAVHYIMGPLDVAGQRKLGDIAVAIAKLISLVVRQRGHKSYDNGRPQFFEGKGGFSSVTVKSMLGPGAARIDGDAESPSYFAMTVMIETTERTSESLDDVVLFDGFDLSVGVGDAQEIQPDAIEASSDPDVQPG